MNELLPDVRKKLRELTHAHLLRPDPVSWMVAADLLEESRRGEEAALWRRRGEWFDDIRREVKACLDEYPNGYYYRHYYGTIRHVDLDPFRVGLRRRKGSLGVWVSRLGVLTYPDARLPVSHPWCYGRKWRLNVTDPQSFFNNKVIELIDALHKNPL